MTSRPWCWTTAPTTAPQTGWTRQPRSDSRLRVIHADHRLGEAAAKNIVLKQSLGRTVVLIDTSVEIAGDIYGPIDCILDDDKIWRSLAHSVSGTDNLHHFHDGEDESGEMDAMQAYCFAFRRKNLREVGPHARELPILPQSGHRL